MSINKNDVLRKLVVPNSHLLWNPDIEPTVELYAVAMGIPSVFGEPTHLAQFPKRSITMNNCTSPM